MPLPAVINDKKRHSVGKTADVLLHHKALVLSAATLSATGFGKDNLC